MRYQPRTVKRPGYFNYDAPRFTKTLCEVCKNPLTPRQLEYSLENYNKALCFVHQATGYIK